MAPAALGQTVPQPLERSDPIEIPIGTEANASIEQPQALAPRRPLPTSADFRIATWNLKAKTPGETAVVKEKPKAPVKQWRHTFGAERKTADWRKLDKGDLGADIIALQGVTGRRTISRMFNARHFHVVLSRQLLEQWTTSRGAFAVYRDNAPPTTALVYRRQRGVRIAGFRHFLPKSAKQQQGREPAAITAFRLRIYRKLLWVASADIPTNCAADMSDDNCRPHKQVLGDFVDWAAKQVIRQKAPLLLLGRWPNAVKEKFSEIGLPLLVSATNNVECTPAPSAIQVMAPTSIKVDAVQLANPGTAKEKPCVSTAELTLRLKN